MKKLLSTILNFIFKFFPIQNKIVFESGRNLVDGNPKAIYEYMVNSKQTKYKLIYLVEKGTDVTSLRDGDYVYYRTLKSYYHLATAKYWIRSQSMGSLIKKRKGQVYIQLWHGNGALKYMGYDVTNEKKRPQLEHTLEWDYYIAHSKLDVSHIISSSGYNKKFDILGMSCIDNVLACAKDSKFKDNLLAKLNITQKAKNRKIVFYAPTFRDYDLDSDIIDVPIECLSKFDNYLILVRLHPLVKEKINKNLFIKENMINVCDYPDSSELLAISDILITDYSGIFYEFAPLVRPIIFYPYDYDKYCNLRGGFYLDYKHDLPGPICYTENELVDVLSNIDKVYQKYLNKHKKFNEKENKYADGAAAKRFVDNLLSGKYNKEE